MACERVTWKGGCSYVRSTLRSECRLQEYLQSTEYSTEFIRSTSVHCPLPSGRRRQTDRHAHTHTTTLQTVWAMRTRLDLLAACCIIESVAESGKVARGCETGVGVAQRQSPAADGREGCASDRQADQSRPSRPLCHCEGCEGGVVACLALISPAAPSTPVGDDGES